MRSTRVRRYRSKAAKASGTVARSRRRWAARRHLQRPSRRRRGGAGLEPRRRSQSSARDAIAESTVGRACCSGQVGPASRHELCRRSTIASEPVEQLLPPRLDRGGSMLGGRHRMAWHVGERHRAALPVRRVAKEGTAPEDHVPLTCSAHRLPSRVSAEVQQPSVHRGAGAAGSMRRRVTECTPSQPMSTSPAASVPSSNRVTIPAEVTVASTRRFLNSNGMPCRAAASNTSRWRHARVSVRLV